MEKEEQEEVIVKEIDTFDPERQPAKAGELIEEVNIASQSPVEKSDEEMMQEFLSSEENKANAVRLADQIQQLVGKNWFTVGRLANKAKISRQVAYQKVQMAKMFGFAQVKIGEFRDLEKNKRDEVIGKPMFKIAIPDSEKIKAYQDIIQYHKNQIADFELKIKMLS